MPAPKTLDLIMAPAAAGNPNILVCERGNMFGYSDLVVDPRNLVLMRDAGCPVTADITHALQQPTGRALEVLLQPCLSSATSLLHASRLMQAPKPALEQWEAGCFGPSRLLCWVLCMASSLSEALPRWIKA